ncbi:MAG: dephospho-CoA kinase [Alistipes sp.]
MIKVGITGGIGSGKSTVCRLFAQRGVAVYDSDAAAKRLMSEALRPQIIALFGAAAYDGGQLDRAYLARRVFGDPQALSALNDVVHPAVKADFEAWCGQQQGDYVLLESAILFESGFDALVDRTLAVLAPLEVRMERTCRRDDVCEEEVRRRMAAQMSDDEQAARADYTVVNIFEEDLESAVAILDRNFRRDAKNN